MKKIISDHPGVLIPALEKAVQDANKSEHWEENPVIARHRRLFGNLMTQFFISRNG
jgi:hypothetical protein|tara:strand:+ start:67 stop:234 length:168 start_codon:yes stop_codon:yes gene_type:complete